MLDARDDRGGRDYAVSFAIRRHAGLILLASAYTRRRELQVEHPISA